MPELKFNGEADSLSHLDTTQGEFRTEIKVVDTAVRQLIGNANIETGDSADALNAPFVLYVNPYIGKDTFVGDGNDWSKTTSDSTFDEKLDRISLQRVECGYTPSRPFKTIERACLEAGIITSRSYLNIASQPCGDLVSIVLAPAVYDVNNGNGAASVSAISTGTEMTAAALQEFNPQSGGGIIIPRGASLTSPDLRKVYIRPVTVPSVADETIDATTGAPSNRMAMFRLTGGSYVYGLTFGDEEGANSSHHLLTVFEYASKSQLDDYYGKIRSAFSGIANDFVPSTAVSPGITRNSESEIVGPQPATPTANVDTVHGSSPYIYNCSIRSTYGLCGLLIDGKASADAGFRSALTAQFTGVSLQKDMSCWQQYSAGAWSAVPDYTTAATGYLNVDPDNLRMDPRRRNFHIRVINGGVCQAVSTFTIGQGVQIWAQSSTGTTESEASEVTVTNSSANFGGAAFLADGCAAEPFDVDKNWEFERIRRPIDLSEKTNNIQKIYLGTIESTLNNATTINLEVDLEGEEDNKPTILDKNGYSLVNNSRIWVEAQKTLDYSSTCASPCWEVDVDKGALVVNSAFENENSVQPGDEVDTDGQPQSGTGINASDLNGARVYVRRLKDTRKVEERTVSALVDNTAVTRIPLRDYIFQLDIADPTVDSRITKANRIAVLRSAKSSDTNFLAQIVLRQSNGGQIDTGYASGTYYRPGDTVIDNSKHFTCVKAHTAGASLDIDLFKESYVFMQTESDGSLVRYEPQDYFKNDAPIIVFDNDTDDAVASTDLGWDFTTCWTAAGFVRSQYESSTDYKGMLSLLKSLGYSTADARTILAPQVTADRDFNPADGASPTPSGGVVTGKANWDIMFLRMTNIRAFGQAFEWAGYSNYSKALPKYQKELGSQNRFTYYGAGENGGQVYYSGFNEEGFQVSPQGITNLSTGQVLGAEQIGSPDVDLDPPTFFPTLEVGDLTVNNITIDGQIIVGDGSGENPSIYGHWQRTGDNELKPKIETDFVTGGTY